jgi:SAM-dependent methyltransferase
MEASMLRLRPFIAGIATFVPGLAARSWSRTGGSNSARYCYSVWLRHLVNMRDRGVPIRFDSFAELGPGDSLGTGLAALLSGARRFDALEVVRHDTDSVNLQILDELVALFRARADIPGAEEFPGVRPLLESYRFPREILSEAQLEESLAPDRLAAIRRALVGEARPGDPVEIRYRVPWNDEAVIEAESLDLILSQAVLEHVDDLPGTYAAMHRWLKPGAVMSHVIDYSSHRLTRTWWGHWAIPDLLWWIVRGRRSFLINRQPHSRHRELLGAQGFDLASETTYPGEGAIPRALLAPRFRGHSDADRATRGAMVVATRAR